jgi:Sulfotransferase domain
VTKVTDRARTATSADPPQTATDTGAIGAAAGRRVPNMFIIGAPKSGTTSMYEYLKGHPEIFLPDFKEPSYFAAEIPVNDLGYALSYGHHDKQYYDLFAAAGTAKVVGEGSTRYIYSWMAPRLIHEVSPGAKIVVMLRNPVDMIHSLHAWRVAAGREDLLDFEEALAADDDRSHGRRIPSGAQAMFATYLNWGMFGQHLMLWFDTFGSGNVHVTIFEEMIKRPDSEFQRLLKFLDVDPTYRPPSFAVHNPARAPRSRLLRQLLNTHAAMWLRWRAMGALVGNDRARSINHRLSRSSLQWRATKRKPISPELRRQLQTRLAPDVQLLSRLLGRDMSALWFGNEAAQPSPASSWPL